MRTLLALPLLVSCAKPPTACAEIGCISQLTVHVEGPADPPVGLAGTVTVGGHEYAVDCDGTSDPEVSCAGSDIVVTITEGGGEVDYGLGSNEPGTEPHGWSGVDTVTPDWTEDHPNGEDCPSTCWSAEMTAELFVK